MWGRKEDGSPPNGRLVKAACEGNEAGAGAESQDKILNTYPPTYKLSSPGTRDNAILEGGGL